MGMMGMMEMTDMVDPSSKMALAGVGYQSKFMNKVMSMKPLLVKDEQLISV